MGKIHEYTAAESVGLNNKIILDVENGGEYVNKSATIQQVGEALNCDIIPISSNDSTSTKTYIDNKLSRKADKSNVINPPDFSTIERTALTSDAAVQVTSTGAWYAVRAINTGTSGSNYAFILDENNDQYLSASSNPAGTFIRAMTNWLYFPSGAKFYARATFTYAADSGLLKAECLNA